MWRFTKNNGLTEGFHRKMKLVQRRAYGFRNFNNYRLRVTRPVHPDPPHTNGHSSTAEGAVEIHFSLPVIAFNALTGQRPETHWLQLWRKASAQ